MIMKNIIKILFVLFIGLVFANGNVLASQIGGIVGTGVDTGINGVLVTPPTANVSSGTYTSVQSVSLAAGSIDPSYIYYTTDGSTPNCSTSLAYSGPITISKTTTLNAITCLGSKPTSSFEYVIDLSSTYVAPTASLDSGTYSSSQSVTLTASGSDSIYYTTDGSTPVCATTGTLYSGTITVSSTKTIKAVACYGSNSSDVATFTYTISSSSSGGGGGGGGSSSSDDDEENPYIVSMKVYDGNSSGSIGVGDYIKITFSEAIKPTSINSSLTDGGSVSGVAYSSVGGIVITSAGVLTINSIASFDVGTVGGAGEFSVDLKLSSNGKVLTITLADGDSVTVSSEDFDSAKQIGGNIKDADSNEMKSDSSIDDPEGTFGSGTSVSDSSEGESDTITGDINSDGSVDEYDFALMMPTWGLSTGAANFNSKADLNSDGTVNEYDFAILMLNWGK